MAVLMLDAEVEGPNGPGGPDGFAALDDCTRAAERLAATRWAGRPGAALGEALLAVGRVERMVTAAKVALVGAFDASGQYRFDQHPSVATWLAAKVKADPKRVNHQRFMARRLRTMPLTERAFERGSIGFEHAAVLARANTPRVAVAFAEAERELVAAAREMDFDEFCLVVDRWLDYVLPERAEKRARDQEERRAASASRTWEGMVRVDAWLDAIGGTEFLAELHRIEKEMFEADWAEARARVGDRATAADLRRTAVQRRADAMVEMARRSATCDTPGRPPKWVLNIMMGVRTFFAESDAAAAERDPWTAGCTGHHPAPGAGHDDRPPGAGEDLGPSTGAPESGVPGGDGDPHPSGTDGYDGGPDDGGSGTVAGRPTAPTPAPGGAPAESYTGPPPARPPCRRPLPDWWGAPDPLGPDFGALRADTMCELEDETLIAPSQALALGLAGLCRRVVFGPDGHILDFGQARDTFTGPLREAITIRDRFCTDPGCRVPGRHGHIDHIVPRSRGGPTSERNGRCQCSSGNHMKGAMPPDQWHPDDQPPEPRTPDDDGGG